MTSEDIKHQLIIMIMCEPNVNPTSEDMKPHIIMCEPVWPSGKTLGW